MASLEEIRKSRARKIDLLRKEKLDPYPARTEKTHRIGEIIDRFEELTGINETIVVAGRIRGIRRHGNATFLDIADETGQLQAFVSKELLGDKEYDLIGETADIGDFAEIAGEAFTTDRGEKTLRARTFEIISKALRSIPTEHFGLEDKEERLRKRYLDLISHPEVRDLFYKKSRFWSYVREFFLARKFLEVETPVLEHTPGGAEAEPFKTHYNALDTDFFLRISLELPLKRLIVGGYEKVFEIGRIFRNEGIDAEHLQEYTQLEYYEAYADYKDSMMLVEQLFRELAKEVVGSTTTEHAGKKLDWAEPWTIVDYEATFNEHTDLSLFEADDRSLAKKAESLGVRIENSWGKGRIIDKIFKRACLPKIVRPSFLVNPPVEIEPLAKRLEGDDRKVERFQVVADGTELGKGFSELNDPEDQRKRFEAQMKLREKGDTEAQMLDEDFLEALEYGMPPTAGFGMSERLFAFLLDRPIRETVIFPAMRRKAHD